MNCGDGVGTGIRGVIKAHRPPSSSAKFFRCPCKRVAPEKEKIDRQNIRTGIVSRLFTMKHEILIGNADSEHVFIRVGDADPEG